MDGASRTGRVDILIGTHRILSKDIGFADLGLLVVDEEQRFGVAHKERIKSMRKEVDVLTLLGHADPAHPPPLAWSASGTCSVIETPPEARLPIQTRIAEDDDGLVRDAINRELDRGGQVFYVHNRVETIESRRRARAARWCRGRKRRHRPRPDGGGDARAGDARLRRRPLRRAGLHHHHRVGARHPEREHDHHRPGRYVRAGAALPAARAGSADPTAAPTPTCSTGGAMPLSPVARKRLHAIFSASDLGAGYQIALSDLEIRGAGNILGAEQHGFMAAVGFELYTRMLAEAVDVRRGRVVGARARRRCGWTCPAPPTCPMTTSATPGPSSRPIGALPRSTRRPMRSRCGRAARPVRPDPEPVEGLFRAVARAHGGRSGGRARGPRRGAAGSPSSGRASTARPWCVALTVAGFRPDAASNQVRIPVPPGRDPVDTALRALAALGEGVA